MSGYSDQENEFMSREAEEKLGTFKHMARANCRSTRPQSICKALESGRLLRGELPGREGVW